LVWDTIPTANGASADKVWGQPSFDTSDMNTTANGMAGPSAVWAVSGNLYVGDAFNNRVLIFLNSVENMNMNEVGSSGDKTDADTVIDTIKFKTNMRTFRKDRRCHYSNPPELTWIVLEPKTIDGVTGLYLTWTQYTANKVNILIDNGTGDYPWKVLNTPNDGSEFLPNVSMFQKIKIQPVNHCNAGEYSKPFSGVLYPNGWYNIKNN